MIIEEGESTDGKRHSAEEEPTQGGRRCCRKLRRINPQETFGRFLADTGLIDEQVLDRAKRAAKTTVALAKFLGLSLATDFPLQAVLPELIAVEFIRRNKILPLGTSKETLRVGVVDPFASETLRSWPTSWISSLRSVSFRSANSKKLLQRFILTLPPILSHQAAAPRP